MHQGKSRQKQQVSTTLSESEIQKGLVKARLKLNPLIQPGISSWLIAFGFWHF